jgi:hypothetical protein
MTRVFGIPAIALGVAASVSLLSLGAARADTSGPTGTNAAAPSLAEPSPTPGWAEAGPSPAANKAPVARHRPGARHTAWRHGHRYYVYRNHNPVVGIADGVVGGVADLGSMAAYPFYCFPNYGSCHVRLPYRP